MNKTPPYIADSIYAKRVLRRLSQAAVAEKMRAEGHDWHQQTVATVEKSQRALAFDEALSLAAVFGCSIGDLAGGQA